MVLKKAYQKISFSNNLFLKFLDIIIRTPIIIISLFSARKRSEFSYTNGTHQISTYTRTNRYPLLFRESKRYFLNQQREEIKILSFGCSSGEEVYSLGKYFPKANIFGTDMNLWCLEQCIKKYPNDRFAFHHRNSPEFIHSDSFDAIFCLSVFQRNVNKKFKQIPSGFLFENFDNEITILDRKLKINGLLIIDRSDFSFSDTSVFYKYKVLEFEKNLTTHKRPLFDKNNIRISEQQQVYRIYIKTV